jgi:hypothetical protein
MCTTSASSTGGQEILSQEHREWQSTCSGQTGMSLLVDSFVQKDQVLVLSATFAITISLFVLTVATQSYTVTTTDDAQTELDSPNTSEIITLQLKIEYSHKNYTSVPTMQATFRRNLQLK